MNLQGKKALVTGARRGIGRGIAQALAGAGCSVGINDIERDAEADHTLDLIRAAGSGSEFFLADISDAAQVGAMMESYRNRFGGIDILVNNPFWCHHVPFLDITEDDWDRTIDVCLKGYFLCSQAAARMMIEQQTGGAIVCISSVHADRVWPTATAYGVAKAGVDRLVKSMAVELGPHRIRANAIQPGFVDTGHAFGEPMPDGSLSTERQRFIPAGRYATPEDIGRAVVFLTSDAAANVTGAVLPVDGGFLTTGIP